MKSIRLTNDMKLDILKSILSKWEETNIKPDIYKAANVFGMYLWSSKYGKYKKQIDALPIELFHTSRYIKFCVDGQVDQVTVSEYIPSEYGGIIYKSIKSSNSQYTKYNKVADDFKDWQESRRSIQREAEAIINSVNTSKQLVEVWPDVEPFLPAHIADPDKAIRLPAITVSRLNERIGI